MSKASASKTSGADLSLTFVRSFPGMRVLAWDRDVLYASSGYRLLRFRPLEKPEWEEVGSFPPAWWRTQTSGSKLTFRLFRDGFHALAVLASGHLVAALPGAIATLAPAERNFKVTHRITRGTRPLFITAAPDGNVFWGEYFDNPEREEVRIYGSHNQGSSWEIVHAFPPGSVRHIHNIVYDKTRDRFWVLTGDEGNECQILSVSLDWREIDIVLSGNQQARAVAAVPSARGLYFASDTPHEQNHIYRLSHDGQLERLAEINGSSLCGCAAGDWIFFSTMVEPSQINRDRHVNLYGTRNGADWNLLQSWQKDSWPMKYFQYGNAFLPTGNNTTNLLAVTTMAVKAHDLETSLWQIG